MLLTKQRLRLGIMGGTFNPPHDLHISLALTARREAALDGVLMIPTGSPPHKSPQELAPAQDRMRMVQLCTQGLMGVYPSSIEVDRPGTTYTVDTIAQLKAQYGENTSLFFIIGADTLLELEKWKDFPRIAVQTDFIVFPRGEVSNAQVDQAIGHLQARYCNEYIRLGTHASGLSSSQLRTAAISGKWQGEGTHSAVVDYIRESGLYQPAAAQSREQILSGLTQTLAPQRLAHTLEVEKAALALALHHNVSLQLAARAALLHDCAKVSQPQAQQHYQQAIQNLGLGEEVARYGSAIFHGQVGAAWARRIYGEQDPQVLSAIACHTFGKVGMSKLDQVVCLADLIEPTRTFDGVQDLRDAALRSLDEAMLLMYERTAEHVMRQRQVLHPDMILAYNSMVSQRRTAEETA